MRNLRKSVLAGLCVACAAVVLAGPSFAQSPGAGSPSSSFAPEVAGRKLVEQLAAGQFEKIEALYDSTMVAAMPPGKLAHAWNALLEQVGAFQSVGETKATKLRGYDVVTVAMKFQEATIDTQVSFSADGKIAGLYFRPHAVWARPAYAKPDSFTEETLTIVNGKFELPATLTVPKGDGPFAAVVLVHGSGPNDSDETIGPNKVFKDLAWGLASRGVAVLRYAKRTLKYGAQSNDDPSKLTVEDETISDARAAALVFAKESKIDPARVFVLGHSLGGYLAPRIALGDTEIGGIVILAGNTRPIEQLAVEQIRYLAGANGNSPTEETQKQIAAAEEAAKKIESPNLKPGDTVSFLGGNSPASYWLDLRGYRPVETAAQLRIPVLILQGGRDYQVTPANFEDWKKALGGRANVTLKLYPDLNHLFMAGSGPSLPAEYNKLGHVQEEVVADIAAWITGGGKLAR